MDIKQAKVHNLLVMASSTETHAGFMQAIRALQKQMLATAPTSEQGLKRMEAGIAIARGVEGLGHILSMVLGQTETGTTIRDAQVVLDPILDDVVAKTNEYIEAKRADNTTADFAEPQIMATVIVDRDKAAQANALLDTQSKALGHAMDKGLIVDVMNDDTMIAHKPLTDEKVLVS